MTHEEHAEQIAGAQAGELLGHPAFQAASKAILDGIAARRRTVAITDEKMMLRLILLEQCWGTIEQYLAQCRDVGQTVQFKIEEDEKRRNSVVNFFGRALRA